MRLVKRALHGRNGDYSFLIIIIFSNELTRNIKANAKKAGGYFVKSLIFLAVRSPGQISNLMEILGVLGN